MSDPITRLTAALEGQYVVERELGEGGMATVYLAQDLKHERKVALKVLKPELAAVVGEERFLSEIRTTASLQHPHILPLHDSGAADGLLYYVMPYVDGETLRDRLEREKQLPIDESVRIASAVAQALQAAHDQGIIHRDIKPANILLSRGEPLVSDFGIAIAVGAAGGNRLTETGLSVGTPFYMSPEQATGDQAVGPQSDTYALAAVLCEMLTGDPPYMGSTAQAVLGQIIAGDDVSVTKKRKAVPGNIDAAVRKGLEKLPADRFSTAAEFATALTDPSFSHGDVGVASGAAGRGGAWLLTSAALALALLASLSWTVTHPAPTPVVSRTAVAPLQGSGGVSWGRQTAISPDGSLWVVPDASGPEPRLAFKARESVDLTPIPGTEGAADVVFAPDGQWILYVVDQVLYKRPVVGGSAIALADDLDPARVALDWLDDGTILYERTRAPEDGLREIVRIPENGGEILQTAFAADSGVTTPIWTRGAPGSKGGLVVTCFSQLACSADRATLLLADFETGAKTVVQEGVARAWFAPSGHIVYVTDEGAVLARPIDLGSLTMADATIPLFEGVRVGLGFADIILGDDGTLLYAQGGEAQAGYELVWVDRAGEAVPVDPEQEARRFAGLSLSPDDRFLGTAVDAEGRRDVWVKELPDGPFQRMTGSDVASAFEPVWSGDGQRILFGAFPLDESLQIRATRADGSSGSDEVIMDTASGFRSFQITPDGEWLAFARVVEGRDTAALGTLNLVTGELREEILGSGYHQNLISLSPDGNFIAYMSNETGSGQVYVRPFPDLESRRWPVSTRSGGFPVWSRGTNEIFHISGQDLMVAQYTTEGGFRITNRQRLFEYGSRYILGNTSKPFDVSADGQRLLMTRVPQGTSADQAASRLIMVQNWFEELEALAGAG